MKIRPRISLAVTVVAALVSTGAPSPTALAANQPALTIEVVSSDPQRITGSHTLVEVGVQATSGADPAPAGVRVFAGSTDVTDRFKRDPDRGVLVGNVPGLPPGSSVIRTQASGYVGAEVAVKTSPATGPLFSGPKQKPFKCQTTEFKLRVIGGTLGAPLDENCSIKTRVDYVYRTTSRAWAAWPKDAKTYPRDMARTTTSTGAKVPFVVRMTTGTLNRGIFQSTILHDPLKESKPTPTVRPSGWNDRLVYAFGGGCSGGWYRQGASNGDVLNAVLLSKGFAVTSNSLNEFRNNCNELLAAETAAMTKEIFIETFGRDTHTIGYGCSGGSYQANQIADNYPGVLDGIIIGCSFPEVAFSTVNLITDAELLQKYFAKRPDNWTAEQKRAVTGFLKLATMDTVAETASRIDPGASCDMVSAAQRYDPATNPDGVRCGVYQNAVNVYGADPETGFARRPLDNQGVQYGLGALKKGKITVDQFLDLNENVGGHDIDGNIVSERTVADDAAVERAYRSGRLTNGGLGLKATPIIDYRMYVDDKATGDIHLRYHSLSLRERLIKANGNADNYVGFLESGRSNIFDPNAPLMRRAVNEMDAWLTNLDLGSDKKPTGASVVAAKPVGLVDVCMTRGERPTVLEMPLDRNPSSRCEQLYPSASFPREVAGESIAADIIACTLKPPARDDYPTMTASQWQRLVSTIAAGVCDYSKPGKFQTDPDGVWQQFPAPKPVTGMPGP